MRSGAPFLEPPGEVGFGVTDRIDKAAVASLALDEVDYLRAQQYDLLAVLLGRPPTAELLRALAGLSGGDSVRPALVADDRIEFHVPASARVVLNWSDE